MIGSAMKAAMVSAPSALDHLLELADHAVGEGLLALAACR